MTDKEKLTKVLDELGVEFVINDKEGSSDNNVVIKADDNLGYNGFFATFMFTKENKFINVGIFE